MTLWEHRAENRIRFSAMTDALMRKGASVTPAAQAFCEGNVIRIGADGGNPTLAGDFIEK